MPDNTEKNSDPDKLVELCRLYSIMQANLLKTALESKRIKVCPIGDNSLFNPHTLLDDDGIKVIVPLS